MVAVHHERDDAAVEHGVDGHRDDGRRDARDGLDGACVPRARVGNQTGVVPCPRVVHRARVGKLARVGNQARVRLGASVRARREVWRQRQPGAQHEVADDGVSARDEHVADERRHAARLHRREVPRAGGEAAQPEGAIGTDGHLLRLHAATRHRDERALRGPTFGEHHAPRDGAARRHRRALEPHLSQAHLFTRAHRRLDHDELVALAEERHRHSALGQVGEQEAPVVSGRRRVRALGHQHAGDAMASARGDVGAQGLAHGGRVQPERHLAERDVSAGAGLELAQVEQPLPVGPPVAVEVERDEQLTLGLGNGAQGEVAVGVGGGGEARLAHLRLRADGGHWRRAAGPEVHQRALNGARSRRLWQLEVDAASGGEQQRKKSSHGSGV